MPARDTPLGAIAALERLERTFGGAMSDDRRAALRGDIETLQATYFSKAAQVQLEHDSLRPQVEQWVLEVEAVAS
jgi:hypothetical protein